MRILALNYEFPPLGGGAGNATAHISRELARQGCRVWVLTSRFRGTPAVERRDGYEVHRVPVLRRRVDRCSPLEMASFIAGALLPARRLALRVKPDILHVYFSIPTGPVGLAAARAVGVPYLLSLRGGDVPGFLPDTLTRVHRLLEPLNRRVWDNAAVIVANSEGLRDLAQQYARHTTVQMVPNGVDFETFAPRSGCRPDGVFRAVFVGRLVPQKGVRYILEALSMLRESAPRRVELDVIGAGPEEVELRAMAAGLSLDGAVRFRGWAARDEMPGCYRRGDVFVFPSFEEGMPNVVLEAMASGLPIIASDIYGNRQLVRHGENGFLIPTADPGAIHKAMLALMHDPVLARRMGERSRALAAAFGWGATARSYLDLSRAAVGRAA